MNISNILCVVCARGGSQGVPRKNLRFLCGKPVIHWAIEKGLRHPCIDRVVVSTDSEEIASTAVEAGAEAPFVRPAALSDSHSGKFQVWQHALLTCEQIYGKNYDLFVDIDCTNPLITAHDIINAISYFQLLSTENKNPDAVFTVAEARRNPYFNLVESEDDGTLKMSKSIGNSPVLARQLAPKVFEHVAGVYILSPTYLKSAQHLLDGRAFGYQIPCDQAFDIDSELDFEIIEYLFKRQNPFITS